MDNKKASAPKQGAKAIVSAVPPSFILTVRDSQDLSLPVTWDNVSA